MVYGPNFMADFGPEGVGYGALVLGIGCPQGPGSDFENRQIRQ